ncbi:hypothetical protein SASPL_101610 [Salvia splendens]|uniref:Very-long-chain (3R)-3-hydroxyacyl-CoA dehydratase n=1 Tax=Salvia splendens TaxID=180675 RepID=A0A8X9ACM5_SALSN|nr:hypothetical protein SASPL_101610 [Salvia splendens]
MSFPAIYLVWAHLLHSMELLLRRLSMGYSCLLRQMGCMWPYPFLDLSTPWAPLWYLALALVHIPFYGLYVWLTKAKHKAFSTWFPNAFMRFPKKKEI